MRGRDNGCGKPTEDFAFDLLLAAEEPPRYSGNLVLFPRVGIVIFAGRCGRRKQDGYP